MSHKRGACRAQVSMEFLLVMALALLIIVPLILFFVAESQSSTEEVNAAQIGQILRKIAANAETVYAFGEPTTLTLRVYMPQGVEAVNISNTELIFTVRTKGAFTTISENLPMNITGDISNHVGIHRLRIQAANNSVVISEVS